MTVLTLPRLPLREVSRRSLLVIRPTPRSSFHIFTHARCSSPHHGPPPSLILSTPPPGRLNLPSSSSKLDTRPYSSQRPAPPRGRGRKTALILLVATATAAAIYLGADRILGQPLNPTTFVPFTVVSREQISPTAFVLTVRPSDSLPGTGGPLGVLDLVSHRPARAAARSAELFDGIWSAGATWSVEVKQPQLQVARDYTPLPPPAGDDGLKGGGPEVLVEAVSKGEPELRFLIRRMHGGEVSSYLAGLKVGDEVELRGPHYGFDVRRRLGDKDRVVFLAGGTGIAPALQVVKTVLEGEMDLGGGSRQDPRVDVLWANRQRADCIGCPGVKDANGELQALGGPILDQLAEIQRKYPGRVTVRCTADEERSFVQMSTLAGLVTSGVRRTERGQEAKDCWLHSQEAVAWRPAADVDAETTDKEAKNCDCGSGKNLLFVSGPDGFIEHFAGPKRWANGMELQGPVGGILGKVKARYPDAMKDWLVLKL